MWFWLSLAAAVLTAIEAIINKRSLHKIDPVVFTWSLFSLTLPLYIVLAFKDGIPTFNSFFYVGVVGSSLAYVFSKSITNNAIRKGTLSKLIPLTTFSVLFTYLFGLIFLSESVTVISLTGLVLIVIGAYILNAEGMGEDFIKPFKILFSTKASLLYIFAMLLGSVSNVFDKTAINNTTPANVSLVLLVEQLIMTVLLTIYLIKTQKGWVSIVQNNFWKLLLNSLLFAAISLLAFTSFSDAPIALAQGVKRLSILLTLFLGIVFLKDHPTKHTWIATIIMITGVILIKISS